MSERIVAPGGTIGIFGGGQLGRMLAIAAARLGYRTHIYAPDADPVAAQVANAHTRGAYDDQHKMAVFASHVDVVTYEFENVPVSAVEFLSGHVPVRPGARSLAIAQDRWAEKAFARSLGIAMPEFGEVSGMTSLVAAVEVVGTPAVLKTAREGYDGKGQARIDRPEDAEDAWLAIGRHPAVLEERIDFLGEISVLLVRGLDGAIRCWDSPENIHENGILMRSIVPAGAHLAGHAAAARQSAIAIAEALGHVGVLACEFFATGDGPLFNEIAPRVHNSGHWTIEGATTSQFENHIRAVCGLPLGDVALTGESVEMLNLIGEDTARWPALLADDLCHLHLYGKGAASPGRKMGHATWVHRGHDRATDGGANRR